jgi:hypothetical protein
MSQTEIQIDVEDIPTEDEIIEVIKKTMSLRGYIVTAHQFGPNRTIINEQALIFLGDEWAEIQAQVVNHYVNKGDWFVNISQLTRQGARRLLKRLGS